MKIKMNTLSFCYQDHFDRIKWYETSMDIAKPKIIVISEIALDKSL